MAEQASCMELALRGEKLCKSGEHRSGVRFFEAAVEAGKRDVKVLSLTYSQMGNAHFYLKEYEKALECHRHELALSSFLGDRVDEGCANGNLAITLSVMGKFDEAITCYARQLDIVREHGDKMDEAKALYNFATVHFQKGKVEKERSEIERAAELYEANLTIVKELDDARGALKKALEKLAEVHYLLGNFALATKFQEEELAIETACNENTAETKLQ